MIKTHDAPALPTKFMVSDRTYELVPFLKEGEQYVSDKTMLKRAKKLNANLGKKDGQFILKRQNEIPREFRRKIYMVFTAWRRPLNQQCVAYLHWHGVRWYRYWGWLVDAWGEHGRLVRRRT